MDELEPKQGDDSWVARAGALYRDAALIAVGTLLALFLFEILAGAVISMMDRGARHVVGMPYYEETEWGETYWREMQDLRVVGARHYEPFAIWRLRTYSGETINVDEEGIRHTPRAQCGGEAPTLFVFGGSTAWGVGAPDWGTIPAYLLEELSARVGGAVCVVNMAQGGHVSTQELIELIRKLQFGARPDFVIFYDGINDTVAAAESGRAGVHQALEQIRERFERRDSPLGRLVGESNLGELADRARARILGSPPYPDHFDVDALAEDVVAYYLGHAEIVQALARAYGFDASLFWQPVLSIGEKRLSPREQRLRAAMDPSLVKLYERTWPVMERAARDRDRLFYIANVLDDLAEGVYADHHHVTPVANRAIARRIAELAWGPHPEGSGR